MELPLFLLFIDKYFNKNSKHRTKLSIHQYSSVQELEPIKVKKTINLFFLLNLRSFEKTICFLFFSLKVQKYMYVVVLQKVSLVKTHFIF